MDASALAKAVSVAEDKLDSLSLWLFWATFAVVVGLIIEYAPSVRKLVSETTPHWSERRELLFELVGGVLITVGVAGELVIQFLGAHQETELRKFNDEYVATIQHGTEALRSENLALEARIQPRRLSPEQQKSLANLLVKFPGKTVRVTSYALDVEGAMLGTQILRVANGAGLPIDPRLLSEGALGSLMTGISVTGTDAAMISVVLSALESFGLAVTPNPPPPSSGMSLGGQSAPLPLKIFIGAKPIAE